LDRFSATALRPASSTGNDGLREGLDEVRGGLRVRSVDLHDRPVRSEAGQLIEDVAGMLQRRVVVEVDGRITEVWNCGYKQGVWA
jgi:hypothetical protein